MFLSLLRPADARCIIVNWWKTRSLEYGADHFDSHEHPANPDWSQAAAAELYAAMLSGDSCVHGGRAENYNQLLKK